MTLFTQQATKHYAEQPWFVLNAASGFTLCPSAHPAVSHYYSFMVDINVEATYAVPDGCVDLIFDTNEESASAAICIIPVTSPWPISVLVIATFTVPSN